MRVVRFGAAAMVAAVLAALQPSIPAHAALTDQEFKCSETLAKSFAKLQASILKTTAKCHNDDISGKLDSPDGCETLSAGAIEKIDKAKAKLVKKVAKDCASVCSVTDDMPCVSDLTCPAFHIAAPPNNSAAESCLGKGGQDPFSLHNLDWPGPYCESVLGHSMRSTTDLGDCVSELVETTAGGVDDTIYASFDESSGLTDDAAKCLSGISKAVSKALTSSYLPTAECRDIRRSAGSNNTPAHLCSSEDADSIAAITSAIAKVNEAIDKKCDDTHIAELTGLCAAGGDPPTTVADAQACIEDMIRELATQERGFNRHVYSPIGMLNVTHPQSAAAYCGDGIVTSTREEHTGVGEECDGENDAACGAGNCLPVGDLFECTCDTTPRERFVVNGDEDKTDSDAGWLGSSHDATHNDGFGYVTNLSNCTCDSFSQATCISPSGDDVCDIQANMAPRCSNDIDGVTCDAHGDGDGLPENSDCYRCDDYSINADTWCANGTNRNETLCQSQCIVDATDLPAMPQAPCDNQTDCPEGQTCRGRCDNTITCNKMTEGSPLPLISAANPVCIMLEYKTDITGTKDMVTGVTEVHYTTRSLIQLGTVFAQPCPVCAGSCAGGPDEGDSCYGRCDLSGDTCLFDSDCVQPGDTACLESGADCTDGFCSLDLRCSEGLNAGRLCRPDSTTVLGVVSHDCPPIPNANLSGTGVTQPFGTVTTEAVEFQMGGPCSDSSWSNFDCPCPADDGPNTGVPTRPNACAAACDGGINEGQGCATGDGTSGTYTACVGGGDNGLPCDADSDCDSNNCGAGALACTAGDPHKLGNPCAVNDDCDPLPDDNSGVCSDPCPGARCVPLCMQEGRCNGGARDGDVCSTLAHCKECVAGNPGLIGTPCDISQRCNTTSVSGDGVCAPAGGVTCDLFDPEDGLCAAGPFKYRCNGPGFTTIPCTLEYGTCAESICTIGSPSLNGMPCAVNTDCVETVNVPVSSGCETGIDALPGTEDDIPGAGECEPRPEDCFVNNGFAEGGDTWNLEGSPSEVNINAAFCTPANSNNTVNLASGFGGPSRVRRQGVAQVNVESIP